MMLAIGFVYVRQLVRSGRGAVSAAAPSRFGPAAGRRRRIAGSSLVGLLVFVVMVFPVYWMVATAFKPGQDIQSYTPSGSRSPPTLSNFSDAINRPYFWNSVKNSLIIVGCVVAASLVVAFLAALALAKFHFYGRKAFIVLIIGVQMVPLNALIIPLSISLSAPAPHQQAASA